MAALLKRIESVGFGHSDYYKRGQLVGGVMALAAAFGTWVFCFLITGFWQAALMGWLPALIAAIMAFYICYVLWPVVIGLVLVFAGFVALALATHL